MYRYYRLQIFRFLNSAEHWNTEIENLKATGDNNNKIEQLRLYIEAYNNAIKMISDDELRLVRAGRYARYGTNGVQDIAAELNITYRKACQMRSVAITELCNYLREHYSIEDLLPFYDFDIDGFLRGSATWTDEIELLRAEINSLLNLKGLSSDVTGISGTEISDSVGVTAAKIWELESRIKRIEHYQKVFTKVVLSLEPADYDLLCVFYPKSMYIGRTSRYRATEGGIGIEERKVWYGMDYHYSRGSIDRHKQTVLNQLKNKIKRREHLPM